MWLIVKDTNIYIRGEWMIGDNFARIGMWLNVVKKHFNDSGLMVLGKAGDDEWDKANYFEC